MLKTVLTRHLIHLLGCLVILLITGSCQAAPGSPITSPSQTTVPTEDLGGLSTEAATTLSSLEKLSDDPFYVMHYSGGYTYPQLSAYFTTRRDFSCSLFAALGNSGDKLYGRNFDWDFSPALFLFTDPPDGYASVSMVDLTFLDISAEASATLTDLPLNQRQNLLSAPSIPFDGMNEYGLTIAMAAVPDEYADDVSHNPGRQYIGSIGIIRQVLDHAKNVDEALAIFEQFNITIYGGPPLHYLLADPGGKAALVEFYQGEMVVIPNETAWHMATNHLRCIAQGDGGCPRYHELSDQLSASDGLLDPESAMQLLSDVKQDSTQWSSVYNMSTGDVYIAIGQAYEKVFTFHLKLLDQ